MNPFIPYFSSFLTTITGDLFWKIPFGGCFWKDLYLEKFQY